MDLEDAKEMVEDLSGALGAADAYVALGEMLLPVGKNLIKKFVPLLADAIKTVAQTGLDVREELEPEIARAQTVKAKQLHRSYMAYKKAGFSPTQAFSLVLASVKPVNFSEALSKIRIPQKTSSKS